LRISNRNYQSNNNTMKPFSVCMILAAAATAGTYGLPQGYGPRPGRGGSGSGGGNSGRGSGNGGALSNGCRLEWQTVHSIEEIEEEREQCTPYTEEQCDRVQNCQTYYDDVCENLVREVPETYTEDECRDEYVRSCQKHWKTYPNGDKKWEDDPSTCSELPQTQCRPVEKTRYVPEPYTTCKQVPREECNWEQNCYPVQKEKCESIHTKTPQSKSTQQQVRVCNNNLGGALIKSANVEESASSNPDDDAEIISKNEVRSGLDKEEPKKEDEASVRFTFSS